LLNRRRHFDLYEPRRGSRDSDWGDERKWGADSAMPLSLARSQYGRDVPLIRAFTHKALNSLIQGSAADMMKKAMRDLWRLGYVPHLTVHDEIDDSVECDRQFREIQDVMIEAVKLAVPVKVDAGLTANWGEAK
jgi:DNA polymerase I-like protein with 3'-5' exonuclease and polymerase domains